MKTISSLYEGLKQKLSAANMDTAEQDARYILEYRAGINWSDLITHPDTLVTPEQAEQISADLTLRLSGKPLSKIYGLREFWGLEFSVSEDVLDPRPDTETLIEVALNKFKDNPPKKILDLGTGSGCILIALLKEWPDAQGVGIDISAAALNIAKQNAQNHGVGDRSTFIKSSWLENLPDSDFDLIVSNPPYIRSEVILDLAPEVQKYDPILALDGGENGLVEYKNIILQIKNKIKAPVNILFEIGYDQEKEIMRLVEESRFVVNALYRDLRGNPRVVDISSGDK